MALGGAGGGSKNIEAGGAFVRLFTEDNALRRGLARARSMVMGFAGAMRGAGLAAMGIGGTILAPVITSFLGLNDVLEDTARLGYAADAFGMPVERFSVIAGVARAAGEPLREFIESMVTLGKVASEGSLGKGEVAAQWFKDLNLNAQEFVKLAPDEMFYQFFDAVRSIQDPLGRVRAMMVAFGEDGGKYLLPLLGKSSEELRRMGTAFQVTAEDATQAKAAHLAMGQVMAQAKSVLTALVLTVSSGINWEAVTNGVVSAVSRIRAFLAENRATIIMVAKVAVAMVAGGAAMAAAGFAIQGLVSVFGVLASAVGLVLSPVGLLTVAVGGAAGGLGALLYQTDQGRSVLEAAGATIAEFAGRVKDSWGGIRDAIRGGDLGLAMKIAMGSVRVEFLRVVSFLEARWDAFMRGLKDVLIVARQEIAMEFTKTMAGIRFSGVGREDVEALEARQREEIGDHHEAREDARRASEDRERAAQDQIRRLDDELDRLKAEARGGAAVADDPLIQRLRALLAKTGTPPATPVPPQLAQAIREIPSAVKGAFQAPDWRQLLSRTDSVASKNLAANEKTATNTGRVADAMANMPMAVFK